MWFNTRQDSATAVCAVDFVAGLREEQTGLATLTGLLQAEQDALVQGDADRVARLAQDKATGITKLVQLDERRSRHLKSQGLNDNSEGMQKWLGRYPELAMVARNIWRGLLAQAEEARQLNQCNGRLIASHLQQNQTKFAVLQTAAAPDVVYRCDGGISILRGASSFSQAS